MGASLQQGKRDANAPSAHFTWLVHFAVLLTLHAALLLQPTAPPARLRAVALPVDTAVCVAAQVALLEANRTAEAAEAPRAERRRRLALVMRIHGPDFVWAPQALAWRASHPEADWDYYFIMSDKQAASALAAYLAERGLAHLSAAYTLLFVDMWRGARGQPPPRSIHFPNWPGLKTFAGMLALHPCYDMLLSLDADEAILRPESLVALAEARLRTRLAFVALPTAHASDAVGITWPLGMWASEERGFGQYHAQLRESLQNFTLATIFGDVYLYAARDVPAFFRDTGAHLRTTWYNLELGDELYWAWKLALREWAPAPVYITPASPHFFAGSVWQMRRGADWLAIRDGYGAAPAKVHQALCFDAPAICKDDANGIMVAHSLDWNRHAVKMAAAFDACWEQKELKSAVDVFFCAQQRAPPPPGEFLWQISKP
jgi:hypothetical protein